MPPVRPTDPESAQGRANSRLWSREELALNAEYRSGALRPVERVILDTYRDAFSERILELGCGAGRITAHLARSADSLLAVDISPSMVAACRRRVPDAVVEERDLRDLDSLPAESFEVVVAGYGVLDVLPHTERQRVLDQVRRLLTPYGHLVMSSHNRAKPPSRHIRFGGRGLRGVVATTLRLPKYARNRRAVLPYEHEEEGYAVLNDVSHDYQALHYYITRDAQERQLAEHGFALLECRDLDGELVAPGQEAGHCRELHYVARRTR